MTNSDKKALEIPLPDEWAVKRAFGPMLSDMEEVIKRLYGVGSEIAAFSQRFDQMAKPHLERVVTFRRNSR